MTRFDARRQKQRTASGKLWSPEQLEARVLLSVNPLNVNSNAALQNTGISTPRIVVGSLQSQSAGLSTVTNVDVAGRSVTLSAVPAGSDFSTLQYTWQTVEVPSGGGRISYAKNSSNAAKSNTLTFDRAGTYQVKVTIRGPGVVTSEASIRINVIQVATSLQAATSASKKLSSTSQVLNGLEEQFTATSLDQFGRSMAEQPSVTWQVVKSPAGSSPTLTANGNAVSVGFNRVGVYTLRAQVGTLKLDGAITIVPVLTSFSFTSADGSTVESNQTLSVTTRGLQLNYRPIDQFGHLITSPPPITWITKSAPVGGRVTAALSGTVLNLSYSRLGQYSIEALIGNQTFRISSNVVATLTSIAVRTDASRDVGLKSPLSVSGTSQHLTAFALDQFGASLQEQPTITWQSTSVASGGTVSLTTSGNSVNATVTRSGAYGLKVSAGSTVSNISLNFAQSLSQLTLTTQDGTAVQPGGTITVAAAAVQLALRGIDQFGEQMKSLPTTLWSTTLSPNGVTALPGLANGTAKFSFNRLGTFSIRINNGSNSISFNASVVPILSTFKVQTSENQPVPPAGNLNFTGTSIGLTAIGVDQFGGVLAEQPTVTWQTGTAPTGGTATLNTNGNSVSAAVSRDGKYSLRALSGTVAVSFSVTAKQTLTAFQLLSPSGSVLSPTQPLAVNSISQKLTIRGIDQFGNSISTLPRIVWTTSTEVSDGKATVSTSASAATVTFNRVGNYLLLAEFGAIRATAAFQVVPTVTTIIALNSENRMINPASPVSVTGTTAVLKPIAMDQFGLQIVDQPQILWTTVAAPLGVQFALNTTDNDAILTFNRSGAYAVRAAFGTHILNLRLSVAQTSTSLALTTSSTSVTYGGTRQLTARSLDQFEIPMTAQPVVTFEATGGTVTSKGLFTAGNQAGTFSIVARAGALTSSLSITIVPPVAPTGLTDPALIELVNGYYGDGTLDRQEVIQILRSTGADGTVNTVELADLRFLVSANTPFTMPNHVRSLASDVVTTNPANRNYKGQTASDLAAGSSSTLLNNLVDKWFLGTDLPQIGRSGLTYQTTVGSLFNGTPSRNEMRQGQLGDCYFIAALGAIADKNPDAIRKLFIDNGDGTSTVRFYAGALSGSAVEDYVTVNRQLPAYANGTLGFSGYGQHVANASTTLWIALAEKAYAQWNETGNEGRDGTNRYTSIEGGWMFNVNAQVLGYTSTNTYFATSNKQNLMSSLAANHAVTLGTLPGASVGGLYGSHAYVVTAYNSSTDTFSLHNPWGVSHPTPLTWAQLQASCSIFVSTNMNSLNGGLNSSGAVRLTLSSSITAERIAASESYVLKNATSVTHLEGLNDNSTSYPRSEVGDRMSDVELDADLHVLDFCLTEISLPTELAENDGDQSDRSLNLDDQLLDIAFMNLAEMLS